MLIPAEMYADQLKGLSYSELLKKRDRLFEEICAFEEDQTTEEEWCVCPSPDVVYQMNLEYLGELCKLISKTFNKEVVRGGMELED